MNIKLSTKVFSITVFALLLIGGISGATWRQFHQISLTFDEVVQANSALRSHMECDMMHDALRGDVLAALRAGGRKDAEAGKEIQKDLEEHVKKFQENLASNKALTLSPALTTALKEAETPLANYIQSAKDLVAAALADPAAAESKMAGFLNDFRVLEESMDKLGDLFEKRTSELQASNQTGVAAFFRNLTLAAVISSVLLFALSYLVVRSIPAPFRKIANVLSSGAEQVLNAATALTASSGRVAESANEQAASLEETSASLEQMASMTKRNSEHASVAKDLAVQTRKAADAGVNNMNQMREAMKEIKAASDNIARIVRSIDEVAFQTNILALNAAVEAARAGEAGAGFAVVADEVRNLAQRSALAARETATKIEDCIQKSDRGVHISETVAASLEQILTQATKMDELVAHITSASKEQSLGIEQVNMAVSQMDRVTQQNAGNAEQSATAAEQLSGEAKRMRETVETLRRVVGGGGAPAPSAETAATPERPAETKARIFTSDARKQSRETSPQHEPETSQAGGSAEEFPMPSSHPRSEAPAAKGDGFKDF